MAALLEICGLRIVAGSAGQTGHEAPIVDDVNLTLNRGEVVGLIGESGAGKTTIGLAALGHVRHGCSVTAGSVALDGIDLLRLSAKERRSIRGRRIAYVAQSAAASFNPAWRLRDQVVEVLVRRNLMDRKDAAQRAIELFAELDLPMPERFGDSYPHQVSGGQLQRAMVAMAMACRPDVLVLDEPTTALDVTTQIELLAALRRVIRQHQTAALYISHDLAVVAQLAHRIMVLRRGRMVEHGEARLILQNPTQDYTRRLVSVRAADTTAPLRSPPHQSQHRAPLLRIDRVSASYGAGSRVISQITLSVDAGETVAVVGESGSGKTSLARAICGLLAPTEGAIELSQQPLAASVTGRSREELRRIQLVYQMPDVALNPHHTVELIIGRPLAFYRGRREFDRTRVAELLQMVELSSSFASRRPGELSGGEKQRVCIARALAAEPDLMICDEVTSALDPLVADGILRLLVRLQEESNLSYLFISHDLGAVRRVAQKLVVMLQGRIVAQGPIGDVLRPPMHDYTNLLLSSVPEMRPNWLDDVITARATPFAASLVGPSSTH